MSSKGIKRQVKKREHQCHCFQHYLEPYKRRIHSSAPDTNCLPFTQRPKIEWPEKMSKIYQKDMDFFVTLLLIVMPIIWMIAVRGPNEAQSYSTPCFTSTLSKRTQSEQISRQSLRERRDAFSLFVEGNRDRRRLSDKAKVIQEIFGRATHPT